MDVTPAMAARVIRVGICCVIVSEVNNHDNDVVGLLLIVLTPSL